MWLELANDGSQCAFLHSRGPQRILYFYSSQALLRIPRRRHDLLIELRQAAANGKWHVGFVGDARQEVGIVGNGQRVQFYRPQNRRERWDTTSCVGPLALASFEEETSAESGSTVALGRSILGMALL